MTLKKMNMVIIKSDQGTDQWTVSDLLLRKSISLSAASQKGRPLDMSLLGSQPAEGGTTESVVSAGECSLILDDCASERPEPNYRNLDLLGKGVSCRLRIHSNRSTKGDVHSLCRHSENHRKISGYMSISCRLDELPGRATRPCYHTDQAYEINHGKKLPAT